MTQCYARSSSLKAAYGAAPWAACDGALLPPPLECAAQDQLRCEDMTGGIHDGLRNSLKAKKAETPHSKVEKK